MLENIVLETIWRHIIIAEPHQNSIPHWSDLLTGLRTCIGPLIIYMISFKRIDLTPTWQRLHPTSHIFNPTLS